MESSSPLSPMSAMSAMMDAISTSNSPRSSDGTGSSSRDMSTPRTSLPFERAGTPKFPTGRAMTIDVVSGTHTPTGGVFDFSDADNPSDCVFQVYDTAFRVHTSVLQACAPQFGAECTADGSSIAMVKVQIDDDLSLLDIGGAGGSPKLWIAISTVRNGKISAFRSVVRLPFRTLPRLPNNYNNSNHSNDSAARGPAETARTEALKDMFIQIFNACYGRRMKRFATLREFVCAVEVAQRLALLPALGAAFRAAAIDSSLDEHACQHPTATLVAAYRIRCKRLYREAFVHVVGRFPVHDYERREALLAELGGGGGDDDDDVCEAVGAGVETEAMFLRGRVDYFFRLVFCAQGFGIRRAPTAGLDVDRFSGRVRGASHVQESDCASGREGAYLRALDREWSVEGSARNILSSLIENNSMHTYEQFPYLTCAVLRDDDIPW